MPFVNYKYSRYQNINLCAYLAIYNRSTSISIYLHMTRYRKLITENITKYLISLLNYI